MHRIPRLVLALVVLLFGVVFATQAALPAQRFGWQLFAGAYQAPPVAVIITSTGFVPSTLLLQTGTTVRWTNNTNTTQTVTGPAFNSGPLAPGQSFEFRFDSPGTYAYHLASNSGLTGKIIVVADIFRSYLPIVRR